MERPDVDDLLTTEVPLSDGRVAVMVEPMGNADMILHGFEENDDKKNVEITVRYVHATCQTLDDEKPDFDAIAALGRSDRHLMMKRNRMHVFGNDVKFELNCMKDASGTGCNIGGEVVVDLSTIKEKMPSAGLAHTHEQMGEIVCKPVSMVVEQEMQTIDEQTDTMAMRIMTVDGQPFMGMASWRTRQLKVFREILERLDGDPGMTTTVKCPTCGKMHRISMLTVPDFFGL